MLGGNPEKRTWTLFLNNDFFRLRRRDGKDVERSCLKVSCSVTSNSLQPHGLYSPWNSPDQNAGADSLSLLQGIFTTQGSNPGLPHCGQMPYQLSHQGSPRILEWVAYPFSRGSSRPRDQIRVSCIAGGFFNNWAIMGQTTPHLSAPQVGLSLNWQIVKTVSFSNLEPKFLKLIFDLHAGIFIIWSTVV